MECRRENIADERTGVGGKNSRSPPLRYPGFPVDLDGVGGPHARFLKRKAHTWACLALRGRKSGFATVGVCDFFIFRCSLRRKAPKSICQQASPGSFDSALESSLFTIDLRSASLRMTALSGGLKYSWLDMQTTRKDRENHRLSG